MFLSLIYVLLALTVVHGFTLRAWDQAYALANATVANLTLTEKVGLLSGVGQFNSRCVGNTTPVSRLGLPAICFQDGPAGVRLVKNVTGFPTGINVAATFSRRLMQVRGQAMAEEFRAKGVHVLLGPAMDIVCTRSFYFPLPLIQRYRLDAQPQGWSRMGKVRNHQPRCLILNVLNESPSGLHSFGPDPYLNGEGAFATITGIQSVGVQACAKHLVANNQEHWRYGLSALVDDRTMHEMYFYPFLRAIEAGVTSIMCAYNQLNGTSSCHNAGLLGPTGLVRSAGFQGASATLSATGAQRTIPRRTTRTQGSTWSSREIISSLAGGVFGEGGGNLASAVNSGAVSIARINQMVERVLAGYYRLGQDSGYPTVNFDAQHSDGSGSLNLHVDVRSAAHTALVREIGGASAVLLKNNRTTTTGTATGVTTRGLPIAATRVKTMAVVGQDALLPNLSCNDLNECNDGTMSAGWGSGSNSLQYIVPPITAIQNFVGTSATIATSLSNDLSAGPAAAKGKDVALVFVNAMSGELGAYDTVVGNMGDRNDLALWYKGGSLVEAVAAVCNNTIAVIHSVGPVSVSWSDHPNITGIIYAGAPGEQTGPAIVDVLYGAVNPSGRLPFSIAEDEASYGTTIVYNSLGFPVVNYTEQLLIDYRYMDAQAITPHYEFGFGLSYTTFAYSGLKITSTGSGSSSAVTVSFTVANSGAVAGTEIPQMYLAYPASAGEPKRVLRGFDEVKLGVGASATVTMSLSAREISIWNVVSQAWVRPAGTFTVTVGASIKDIRLTGTF
ncbi:Glycoside hydrolase family 3 protein [Mycena venus]|uniref:beta-glucosidase n=1 Tax=Mycena venus TaxID=2733690 RepID=A0A8H6XZD2_9AGAR|nr:Glycoside hydrolase family 3 protein [Mycena venus]